MDFVHPIFTSLKKMFQLDVKKIWPKILSHTETKNERIKVNFHVTVLENYSGKVTFSSDITDEKWNERQR